MSYKENISRMLGHVERLADELLVVQMACEALEQNSGSDELIMPSHYAGQALANTRKLRASLAQLAEEVG